MKRIEIVEALLDNHFGQMPENKSGGAFAPANIALCKYWGKRDEELNLPVTSSLSISLGKRGTKTTLSLLDDPYDQIILNGEKLSSNSPFVIRTVRFLDLFRPLPEMSFRVETSSNLPVGAGLASSASGFAALVLAMNQLFCWNLTKSDLSILARLGSGSATRSLWNGFVKWEKGKAKDGMDSFGEPLDFNWPELCIGILIVSREPKAIGSRKAMKHTVETSCFYEVWPKKVATDMEMIEQSLSIKNFDLLGKTAESNALAMHASMLGAEPPILYALPETISAVRTIWKMREEGISVYFTQDAGPNLKLLFLKKDEENIKKYFPSIEIIEPFKAIV